MKNNKRLCIASILICGCKHQFEFKTMEFRPNWNSDPFEHINRNYEKLLFLPFRGYRIMQCKYCGIIQSEETGMTTDLPINFNGSAQKRILTVGIDLGKVGEYSEKVVINGTDIDCK